ncbi:TetR/AcrR family transcriptional regulator C-terminal domain-containing protein [Limosilactobacillus sp.]|uniref:TetR/AcrR family transcriptional regulator C-terminal domain-containing protein n=1 Tax=Limosilactobacillus sp. TaxID=2773925 RepID=UPI003F110765
MYHIKSDKRSLTSATALYRALIDELKTKALTEVNITELVKRAMVGRSTFYRNFDEPLDILKWKCDTMFQELTTEFNAKYRREGANQVTFIQSVFEYWEKQSDVLEALIRNQRIDVIQNATRTIMAASPRAAAAEAYYQYSINLRISIVVGMMITWIQRGKRESASEITQILLKNLKEIPQMPVVF